MSHQKGVFLQGRPNLARMLRPPFGVLSKAMIKLLMLR
jgi:hypothetical protein